LTSPCTSVRVYEHHEAEQGTNPDHCEWPGIAGVVQARQVGSGYTGEPDACGGHRPKRRSQVTMARLYVCANLTRNRKNLLPSIPIPPKQVYIGKHHYAGNKARPGEGRANPDRDSEDVADGQVRERTERCGPGDEQQSASDPLRDADKPVVASRREVGPPS
jgi:hypothetical protein